MQSVFLRDYFLKLVNIYSGTAKHKWASHARGLQTFTFKKVRQRLKVMSGNYLNLIKHHKLVIKDLLLVCTYSKILEGASVNIFVVNDLLLSEI